MVLALKSSMTRLGRRKGKGKSSPMRTGPSRGAAVLRRRSNCIYHLDGSCKGSGVAILKHGMYSARLSVARVA